MNTLATQLAPYKEKHYGNQQVDATKKDVMKSTKGNGRITTETKDKIIDLYKQGYNGVQIAEKIGGIAPYTATYHITKFRKRGFSRPPETTNTTPAKTNTRGPYKKKPYSQETTAPRQPQNYRELERLQIKNEILMELLAEKMK